ncbi:hypothetical protein [Photobacterium sp. GB-56]|uniref:hypothetical protein n=1 Tax=Photobacterium sp. GB-56 TaxID=2022106 RepID=UPI000D186CFB|nr:hypothetical protein [Photobacterium sp. GB-56]PSV27369.1 hypothetical protein C9J42_06945 [Photobacterium sp. GB-56]
MDLEQHIKETCEHLEKTVSLMGCKLCKKLSYIETLEDVLIVLLNENDKGAVSGARYLIGVYLGEIVLNQTGGEWFKSEVNNHLALRINNQQSFPIEAVEDFIQQPVKGKLQIFAKGLTVVHCV